MFIVDNFLKNHRAKSLAWEQARAKNKQEYYGGYAGIPAWRWEEEHPRYVLAKYLKIFGGALLFVAFMFFFVGGLTKVANSTDCDTYVKKDQLVGVEYGDFAGSKGTVVSQNKDCEVDITLTDSTNTFDACKNSAKYCDVIKNNGAVLHIGSSDNVIPL